MSFWDDIGGIATGGAIGGTGPFGAIGGGIIASNNGMPWQNAGSNVGVDPYSGMPMRPGYMQGYSRPGMSISPNLDTMLGGIGTDGSGLQKYEQEAERNGPSQWAKLATGQQSAEEANQRERAAGESAGTAQEAKAALERSGGLSSGAQERIARDSGRNYMNTSQEIGRQGDLNRLQIGVNDEQNRITQLGQLPGMQNQAAQTQLDKTKLWGQGQMFDTTNQINEAQNQNAFNLGQYHDQMQAWGAGKQANATAQAGKK